MKSIRATVTCHTLARKAKYQGCWGWPAPGTLQTLGRVSINTDFLASLIEAIETCTTYNPASPYWSMKQPERHLCTHTRKPSVNVITKSFSKMASNEMWSKCPSIMELARHHWILWLWEWVLALSTVWLGHRGVLSGKYKTDGYDGTPLRPCSKQQPLSCNGVRIATVERGLTCKRQGSCLEWQGQFRTWLWFDSENVFMCKFSMLNM